jgi:hypothetical protein
MQSGVSFRGLFTARDTGTSIFSAGNGRRQLASSPGFGLARCEPSPLLILRHDRGHPVMDRLHQLISALS